MNFAAGPFSVGWMENAIMGINGANGYIVTIDGVTDILIGFLEKVQYNDSRVPIHRQFI